jgi:ABC-type branched-subunit amino acid transport system substrate-binding protein
VAAATVATTLAACGGSNGGSNGTGGNNSASAPGITATTIKLGAHYPLTGVAAPGYSQIPLGAKAYFDYVNSKGGVNGRKIEWDYKDDGYNPTNTSQVVNQLVLKDKVFALMGGLGTPTHSAVGPAQEEPRHLRLADRLHQRGQDHRAVHQAEHAEREGRPVPAGRRLRRRR